MAVITTNSSDSELNSHLIPIRAAKYGKDIRTPLSSAVERLYAIVLIKVGTPKNGVTKAKITEHTNRIKNAVFGEEVRDAFKTAIQLCYSARGISISSAENTNLTNLMDAQKGEDLKNSILRVLIKCCQDVKA